MVEIVDFRAEFAAAFKSLNEAWISQLFVMEQKDVDTLSDPQGKIIDCGGYVFIALDHGEPVGCCALIALADGEGFEVAKMAVADSHKGKGIGRELMAACVDRAKAVHAPRLYLETNSRLAPALGLYRSFGFQEIRPEKPSEYVRADVSMELRL